MKTLKSIFNGKGNLISVGLILFLCFGAAANALAADGDLDSTFNVPTTLNGTVREMALQPDGKILIGGRFDMSGFPTPGNQFDYSRLNPNGSLDTTFFTGLTMSPVKYLVLADGKIIVGGPAQNNNNSTLIDVTRRNPTATHDTSFFSVVFDNYGIQNFIEDMFLQTDGKIFVVGSFGGANSTPRTSIMRLGTNGLIDNTFINPTFVFSVYPDAHRLRRVIVQPDGKILIGGGITQVNGVSRNLVARFNTDGSLDTTFTPNLNGTILTDMVLQPDGKIVVSQASFNIQGQPTPPCLTRLNSNGVIDTGFNTIVDPACGVSALALQSDGKILAAGAYGSSRNGIARLTANGTLDSTFVPNVPVAIAPNKLVVQPDGKILASIDRPFNNSYDIIRFKGTSVQTSPTNRISDFDGDGKSDVSVFRPSTGVWYLQQSSAGFTGLAFGLSTDKLVPADYDGDGKTDVAVYRGGTWYLQRSQLGFTGISFGAADDIPVPADYDGDGKADLAVFRPSTGVWYLQRSNLGFTGIAFGQTGDKPVPADYDGDGKADIAVNRAGTWYINRSQLGFTGIAFGDGNDKLVPADYDGDGKADVAVFRPSNGVWYLQQSTAGFTGIQFGLGTDVPTAADYDGDGKADLAVFRNGVWYLNRTTAGFTGISFGAATDKPIPSVFVP